VVIVPVSDCWANATELRTVSTKPVKTVFASLIENLSFFGQFGISRNERICSLGNAEFPITGD
jgi:hypothetical protein